MVLDDRGVPLARGLGDLAEGDPADAPLGEEALGGVEQARPAVAGAGRSGAG